MNYFQRYLAEEFAEDYVEGRISRRQALKLIASVVGGSAVANSILAGCTPQTAVSTATEPAAVATNTSTLPPTTAPTAVSTIAPEPTVSTTAVNVSPDDPAVVAEWVEPPTDTPTLQAYLAQPAGEGTFPVILVCHENRGLTEHIQDVTRRLAKTGYVALAVDLLSRQGGTASLSADDIPGLLGNIAPEQFVQDFLDGWRYLQDQDFAQSDRVGMVGFCFGGGVTWSVATRMPELKAAAPFYGPPPPVEDVPNINAAVLAIYGGLDDRINQSIPAIEEAMQQNDKVYEKVIYPNADHAFHNDTSTRYNPEAAVDAWQRTLDWFGEYV
jgi:carboxymethylenebutenolidase